MISAPYTILTTKPQKRRLSNQHPELVAILPHIDITTPTLKAVITYSDASTLSHDITDSLTLRAGEARIFNIGFDKIDYTALDSSKTIKHIVIRVESTDFTDQSAQDFVQYFPYNPSADNVLAIYYHNSMSGIDSLICAGDQAESTESNGVITASPIDAVYDSGSAQYKYADPSFRSSLQTSTGTQPGKEIFALKDFFNTKSAFEYRDTDAGVLRLPIIPISEGMTYPSTNSNLKQLQISFQYAFEEKTIDRIL